MGLFGPKKIEGIGDPIAADELRAKMLDFIPKSGTVNQDLSIETNEKYPQGFSAVWKMYTKEPKENNSFKFNYSLSTFTLNVNVDVQERAVYLKTKNFSKTTRVPEGEKVYDIWYGQVKIGELADLQGEVKKEGLVRVYTYSKKKLLQPLVDCITKNGWSVYL